MNSTSPTLTEPGVYFFLKETLKQCREKKYKIYNKIFNILLFLSFIGILGGLLYYKYTGKLTPAEKKAREQKKEKFIFEKIKSIRDKVKKDHNLIITDLPKIEFR